MTTNNADYENLSPAARDILSIYFRSDRRSDWMMLINADYKCSFRDDFYAHRGEMYDLFAAEWLNHTSNPARGNKEVSDADFAQAADFMHAILTDTAENW